MHKILITSSVITAIGIISFFSFSQPAHSSESINLEEKRAASVDLNSEDPYSKMGEKITRGANNLVFGWSELPIGIQEIGNQYGVGAASTWGVLHGLGKAIQRTAVGIFELLTFPIESPQEIERVFENNPPSDDTP